MWKQETMSVPESLLISLLGIVIVFLALIVLDLAIVVISKVIRGMSGKAASAAGRKQTAVQPAAAGASEQEAELMAVLSAVIAEDLGVSTGDFRINSVAEVK